MVEEVSKEIILSSMLPIPETGLEHSQFPLVEKKESLVSMKSACSWFNCLIDFLSWITWFFLAKFIPRKKKIDASNLTKPAHLISALKKTPYRVIDRLLDTLLKDKKLARSIFINLIEHCKTMPTPERIDEVFDATLRKGMRRDKKVMEDIPQDISDGKFSEIGENIMNTLNAKKRFLNNCIKKNSLFDFLNLKEEEEIKFSSVFLGLIQNGNPLELKSKSIFNTRVKILQELIAYMLKQDLNHLPRLGELLKKFQLVLNQGEKKWYPFVRELVDKLPKN